MSRHQPPLPPGPPPRSFGGGDSYRPSGGSNSNNNRDRTPMFHFNGVSTSYKSPPRYNNYASGPNRDPRDDNYRPRDSGYAAPGYAAPRRAQDAGYGQNTGYRRPEDDVYRPQDSGYGRNDGLAHSRHRPEDEVYRPQEGNFTFRHDAPPTIDFRSADRIRPRSPPRQRNNNNKSNRGNSNFGRQGGQRGGYRGRSGPRLASEREFLKGNRAPTPELMAGMAEDETHGVRYMPIEDVSDSSEAEMDMSEGDEADEEADQPKKKQARIEKKDADADSAPKWSNPDPYTVLPPPDETQRKKKDVVKLIRKARVEAAAATSTKAKDEADDFISFDFGDEEEEDFTQSRPQGVGVNGAPTGPRSYSHRDTLQKPQADSGRSSKPTLPPDVANLVDLTSSSTTGSRKRNVHEKLAIPNTSNTVDLTAESYTASRKRTIRDEIKETPTLRQALRYGPEVMEAPILHSSMKGRPRAVSGKVTLAWAPTEGISPTPWIEIDHSDTANMGLWLHKEIRDFYEFVKPRDFEQFMRSKLIEDLQIRVRNSYPGVNVLTFGSFPAGLYLPTADMDVVCVSDQYLDGGRKEFCQRSNNELRKFASWIGRQGLAIEGSVEVIPSAKVPLVKYVDRVTGLKVDISFENTTGLAANKTFQEWKTLYPSMPILVTVIKHLLAMRGLNEPVNGGIGGFSVICLVVSMLQLMPQVQSRTMIPEHHLGEALMEFLDLYGNQFNVTTTGIQFDPPGYASKSNLRAAIYKPNQAPKFCIIDPNNPSNDISGGSSNTATIRACFSNSFTSLQERMSALQYSAKRQDQSILGTILGGNYDSFKQQREHLSHLYESLYGSNRE